MNDTVELAKRYVTGLTLKRGDTMEMVKGLLEMLETRTMKFDVSKVIRPPGLEPSLTFVGPPTVEKETALGSQILSYPLTEEGKRALTVEGTLVKNGYQEVVSGLMLALEKEAPNLRVTVSRTAEGAVFVGADVNRTYSAAEAKALAGKLYREAVGK